MSVIRLQLSDRPLLDGRAFGEVGPYTESSGEAEFAVDPAHPLNQVITDLDLAPTTTSGKVHFTADIRILRPATSANGNGGLFLDVPNRGNSVFTRMLEPGPLATYTGWNPSAENPETLVRALGSTIPFSPEKIAERYPTRDMFLASVRGAAEQLAGDRYILSEDIDGVVRMSSQRWALNHG